MKSKFFALVTALTVTVTPTFAQEKHRYEEYFTAEIMTAKMMKEIQVSFDIQWRTSGNPIEVEIYHTDLDHRVIGLMATISCPSIELEYDVIVQGEVEPYQNFNAKISPYRGEDLLEGETTVTVKEIRYEEMPEIDDMVSEAKEDEDDDSDN